MTASEKQDRKSETVRALTRGLAILRHVNAVGEARPGEIANALSIPRSSVYRLLQTLEEAGYVAFSASANLVRVTRLAASLGDGSALSSQICQIAAPLLAEYAAQLVWPLDLTVHHSAAMVVQETTHGRSPLSIDRAMIGSRLPMLRTSAGRAYLTFCDQAQRELILTHIRRLGEPADDPFLEPLWLARMMYETRERRVALRDAGEFRPHTASLAAPIIAADGIVGCISMIWIRSALNTRDAIESYATPLRELASRIVAALPARPHAVLGTP
ncbi:DNA-binding transcriptional regulator [Pseudochelatococcus contaminans]|uniref:IclR family mhp operon transcriptional activator n=1 Tax=Pseudochelatococcus contaminans TaxID=1538103 RepID=A0A7W5Z6J8_9HYPH|nr:DNA-binding transcriptional regulator [Pseudochelatococcus contaminans]MBB3810406.1 IclR family mhp operon transcriptional activator [Pseudochelatococcus contaminans]